MPPEADICQAGAKVSFIGVVAGVGMFLKRSLEPWLCFLVLFGETGPLGRDQQLGLLSKMVLELSF